MEWFPRLNDWLRRLGLYAICFESFHGDFMREHMVSGFGSLDEVADAVAAYVALTGATWQDPPVGSRDEER